LWYNRASSPKLVFQPTLVKRNRTIYSQARKGDKR
jgi:hypothetical protein